ncbi:MAG: transposase [Acidobacteria bacterium]|nr:transposase [Acidobacteriota bacterium]
MAHARRKFVEAAKASHGQKRSKTLDNAHEIVKDIKAIYQAESQILDEALTAEELLAKRSQKVVPLLEDLETKLLNLKDLIPPKTSLGQAIGY